MWCSPQGHVAMIIWKGTICASFWRSTKFWIIYIFPKQHKTKQADFFSRCWSVNTDIIFVVILIVKLGPVPLWSTYVSGPILCLNYPAPGGGRSPADIYVLTHRGLNITMWKNENQEHFSEYIWIIHSSWAADFPDNDKSTPTAPSH